MTDREDDFDRTAKDSEGRKVQQELERQLRELGDTMSDSFRHGFEGRGEEIGDRVWDVGRAAVNAAGVVPQGADFHGLTVARGHRATVGDGIHPCELGSGVPYGKEPLGVRRHKRNLAAAIVFNDVLDDRPAPFTDQTLPIRQRLEHLLHGPDIPEGGVRRVVGVVAVGGEDVGDEPVPDGGTEAEQHVRALFGPSGIEGQAGQRDKRIPPPRSEPVVARRHGKASIGPPDKKALPFPGKMAFQTLRGGRQPHAAFDFPPPDLADDVVPVLRLERLRRSGEEHWFAGNKPDLELARLKQIFLIGKAALPLHQILHIEAPVGSGVEDEAALHLHEQGRQCLIRPQADPGGGRKRFGTQRGIRAGEVMGIAKGEQGLHAQNHRRRVGSGAAHLIPDEQQTVSGNQHQFPRERHLSETVTEHRPFSGVHFLKMLIPARIKDAGMLTAGKTQINAYCRSLK